MVLAAMTKWLPGWQKKGWKNSSGKEVINREDFEALLMASDGVKIHWVGQLIQLIYQWPTRMVYKIYASPA